MKSWLHPSPSVVMGSWESRSCYSQRWELQLFLQSSLVSTRTLGSTFRKSKEETFLIEFIMYIMFFLNWIKICGHFWLFCRKSVPTVGDESISFLQGSQHSQQQHRRGTGSSYYSHKTPLPLPLSIRGRELSGHEEILSFGNHINGTKFNTL